MSDKQKTQQFVRASIFRSLGDYYSSTQAISYLLLYPQSIFGELVSDFSPDSSSKLIHWNQRSFAGLYLLSHPFRMIYMPQ